MDIRDTYYNMTGDYEGAYGRNSDDRGGYIYSDDSLQRAVDAMQGTQNFGERNFIEWSVDKFGPRAGSFIGKRVGHMLPQAGYWSTENALSDRAYAEQDSDISNAQKTIATDLLSASPRSLGSAYGLLEYLANKFMGQK